MRHGVTTEDCSASHLLLHLATTATNAGTRELLQIRTRARAARKERRYAAAVAARDAAADAKRDAAADAKRD